MLRKSREPSKLRRLAMRYPQPSHLHPKTFQANSFVSSVWPHSAQEATRNGSQEPLYLKFKHSIESTFYAQTVTVVEVGTPPCSGTWLPYGLMRRKIVSGDIVVEQLRFRW